MISKLVIKFVKLPLDCRRIHTFNHNQESLLPNTI